MITLLLRVGCPIMANPNIEFMPVKKKKRTLQKKSWAERVILIFNRSILLSITMNRIIRNITLHA